MEASVPAEEARMNPNYSQTASPQWASPIHHSGLYNPIQPANSNAAVNPYPGYAAAPPYVINVAPLGPNNAALSGSDVASGAMNLSGFGSSSLAVNPYAGRSGYPYPAMGGNVVSSSYPRRYRHRSVSFSHPNTGWNAPYVAPIGHSGHLQGRHGYGTNLGYPPSSNVSPASSFESRLTGPSWVGEGGYQPDYSPMSGVGTATASQSPSNTIVIVPTSGRRRKHHHRHHHPRRARSLDRH